MKPMNNWLAFSLSPHLGINVGNSTQPHSSELNPHSTMGYQSSAQCYGINSPPTQFSSHISELPLRSDGSLCIMEALGRSHGTADWHSRGLQNEGSGVPSSHLFNTELSRFTSQNGNGDGQFENINMGTEREGPKLEDFLSGASLGNQYQESHTHTHTHTQSQLDTLYYGDTNSNNGNKINVNIPLLHCRQRGDVPPSFHAFGSMGMDSSHSYELVPDSQQLAFNAQLDTNTHDQSVFADCSLQLPPGSGLMGISALKTWLRQNPSDKIPASTNASGSPGSGGGLGDLQALTLSMSPGSQSSSAIVPQSASTDCTVVETRKRGAGKSGSREPVPRKSIDTFGQRTSQYRGVTRHRWTGRYEAHLWDNSCRKEGQTRKGRQVYLGGYDKEEKAARAYDLAALKYWGSSTHINFPLETYEKELEEMKTMSRQEYVANLRRKSSGFSRGASIYRGVTRHHQHGRWQARIGRVAGNKDLYLGTFSTQEEAAEAYDIAAIKFRGISAVTNFDISKYDVKAICSSNTLIAGDLAKRNKDMEHSTEPSNESLLQIEEAAGDNRNSQCSNGNGNGNGNGNAKDSSNNNSSSNSNVEGSKPNAQDWQFLDSRSDQDQHKVVSNWAEQRQEDRKPDQSFMESLQLGTHSHSAVLHDLIGLDASTGDANNEEASRLLTDISGGNTSLVTTLSNGNGSNTNTINMESPGNSASENEECHRNKLSVYDNMIAAGDFSQALFFSPPQAGSKMVKYENSNNSLSPWMIPPTAVQPLHSKPNNISVGHLPMFALWNE